MSTSDTSITSTSKSITPLMANPSITSSTIITIEKLKGSNYFTWAADVELWFMGQGYKDHLTTKPDDTMTDPSKWERIDAQLCSMLWQTIDSSLKQIFRPHKTCFSVWEQAKALYTNDISRVYVVCSDLMSLIAPRKLDMPMSSYLGRIQGVLSNFNELLPPAATQQEQLSQREYCTIRDQILASPTIPTLSQAFSRLLRLPDESKSSSETIVVDSSALASQSNQRGGRGRDRGRDVTFFESTPFFQFNKSEHSTIMEDIPVSTYFVPLTHDTDIIPDNGVGESADVPDASRTIPSSSPTTISSQPAHPLLSAKRVSSSYYAFLSSLSSMSVPKTIGEAMSHSRWRQAMIDEMAAFHSNSTWELVPLPPGKSTVGCRWIYTIKVGPDGQIDRLKACLVAKGYTQIFGFDYTDTFSPVAKMSYEEVYMNQPPGFVLQGKSSGMVCRLKRAIYGLKQSPRAWFGCFRDVVQKYGMIHSEADHSVFYRHSPSKDIIYLVIYVDDIIITGQDHDRITQLKNHLFGHFQTKDLDKFRYFLGIEIAQSKEGVVICQRKYALDILEEAGMSNAKPAETPMDPNIKLFPGQGEPLKNPGKYHRLVGRLNYLTLIRPDISFSVSVISQFLDSPCDTHWNAAIRILKYIKGAPGQGLLYTDKGNMQVIGYTDADWAGSPIDCRSTTVMLTAGRDTSSVTIEWVLSLLLNHPEVLEKARAELDAQVGTDRLVDKHDLSNLPYLHNILLETLRLYPATPMLVPHESSDDCKIGGYNILRGILL
ncbi:uncharacterized protein [Coffea arabica]|uniref:Reverse transcriptase Ty1/copia-type domain-containing protein n=1 Tax=Coffea arabica TaxID=13443 RepID=A0ABM4VMD6_COFAR